MAVRLKLIDTMLIKGFPNYTSFIRNLYPRSLGVFNKERNAATSNLLWDIIKENKIDSPTNWKKVRSEVLKTSGPKGQITPINIDALTVGICTSKHEFDLAFSYLNFLRKEGIKLNLATIGKYFKLLYIKGIDGLSREDEDRILSLLV